MKRILKILLIITALRCSAAEYLCRNVSLNEGLSRSNVTSLTRDNRGFLWIGTRFGLNRYDFEHVESYFREPSDINSLPDNEIRAIFNDSRGKLWIACENGLALRNDKDNNFKTLTCGGRPINTRSFYEEKDGLLIGGAGVIYYYDYASETVTPLETKGGSQYYYTRILSRGNDFYILATRWDGLWLYDRIHATVRRLNGFDETGIMACFIDSRGLLWVSPYGLGVTAYDRAGTPILHLDTSNSSLKSNIILDIAENDNKIWFATDGGGICIFDPTTREFDHSEWISQLHALGSVTCLYSDEADNIYAGTVASGAAMVRRVGIHSFQGDQNSRYGIVTAICNDSNGNMWIGDDGNGLLRFNYANSTFSNVEKTDRMKITDVVEYDSNNLLIVSFDGGFYLYNKRTGNLSPAPSQLREFWQRTNTRALAIHMRPLSKDIIAITSDRINLFNTQTGEFVAVEGWPNNNFGESLTPFSNENGRLLCFSQHYILELDPITLTTKVVLQFDKPGTITCAAFDGISKIYFGTEKGISCYDMEDMRTTEMPDMPERPSALACEDENRLWIATTRTVYLKQLDTGNIIGFGKSDGVNPNEYLPNATLVAKGKILFGGAYGLLSIYTDEIKELAKEINATNPSLADININGISIYNKIENGRVVVPDKRTSALLSVIDRGSNAHRSRYYRFIIRGEGREQTIQTFNRILHLNFLEPGNEYEILVSGQRPDGSWNEAERLVTLATVAPWFKSPWLMALLLAACIGFYVWWEFTRTRNRKKLIATAVENYKREMLERELSFLVNTNYALRTPLTLIYAPLKLLLERLRNGEETDIIESLEGIYTNTKKMRDSIDMALELHAGSQKSSESDLSTHDVSRSIEDVVTALTQELSKKNINCSYKPSQSMFPAPYDRGRLAGALTILLRNAIQRSAEYSEIVITASMNGGNIRVVISDTGSQLDEATINEMFTKYYNCDQSELGNSLGFAYAKNIIDLQGGSIGAFNNEDKDGISVWFEIPGAGEIASEAYTRRRHKEESQPVKELDAVVTDVDTSDLTAIVVEEDEELCNFITRELATTFRRAIPAGNGKDALTMIKQYQPDIVITSVSLPGISGLELCHALKKSPETRHIPVILLTALREGSSIENAYGAGADSYLSKPFDMPILLTRCRNLLHTRSVIRERYSHQPVQAEKAKRSLSNADETFMLKIDKIIHDNISNPDLSVELIVKQMATSRSALYLKFKGIAGVSIGSYIADRRFMRAKELLADYTLSVNEISEQLGFSSQRYFSTFFKERSGMTPSAYRSNLKNSDTDDN